MSKQPPIALKLPGWVPVGLGAAPDGQRAPSQAKRPAAPKTGRGKPVSPWKLTPRQAEIMDALVRFDGVHEDAAKALDIAAVSVRAHAAEIRIRMGCDFHPGGRVSSLLAWDRWRRSETKP